MAFGKKDDGTPKPPKQTMKEAVQEIKDAKQAAKDQKAADLANAAYRVRFVSHFANLGAEQAMNRVLNEMQAEGYTLAGQSTVQVAGPTLATYFTFYKEP